MERSTNESTWRKTKKLGSLIGEEQDLTRRKSLANAAFFKLSKLWLQRLKKRKSYKYTTP